MISCQQIKYGKGGSTNEKNIPMILLLTLTVVPAARPVHANTIVYGSIYTSDENQPWPASQSGHVGNETCQKPFSPAARSGKRQVECHLVSERS